VFYIYSLNVIGQEKVGEDKDGKFTITANLKLLKVRWNEIASETVTNYSITSPTTENVKWYYLIGTTEKGIKLATTLAYRDGIFYVPDQTLESSSTCTCSGCGYKGCDPKWMGGSEKWICDMPCLRCTKSVTTTKLTLTGWSQ